MLRDFSQVEKALQTMENAAGSADAEMSIIEDSIDYKLNAIKETWVGVIQDLISRDDFKQLLDNLLKISEALSSFIASVGTKGLAGLSGLFLVIANGVKGLKTGESAVLSFTKAILSLGNASESVSGLGSFLSTLFSGWKGLEEIQALKPASEGLTESIIEGASQALSGTETMDNLIDWVEGGDDALDTLGDTIDKVSDVSEGAEDTVGGLSGVLTKLTAATSLSVVQLGLLAGGFIAVGVAIGAAIKWMNKSRDAAKALDKSLSEIGETNSNIEEFQSKLEDLDKQIEEHKELLKEKNDLIGSQQLKDLETEKSITESQLKLEQAKLEVLKEEAKYKALESLGQDDNWDAVSISEGIKTLGNAKALRAGDWSEARVGQNYNYDTNDRISQLSAEYQLYTDINTEIAQQYKELESLSGKEDLESRKRAKSIENQIHTLESQRSTLFQTFSTGYASVTQQIDALKQLYGDALPPEMRAYISAYNNLVERINYSTAKQNENTEAVEETTQSVKELHDALYKSGNWDDIYVKLNVDLESDAFKQSVANWKEQNAHLLDGITDVDEYNKALEVFNRTAENAVAASMAFNSGFEDLNSNLESYKETLNKVNEEGYEFVESSSDYADTVAQLAADLSGLTGYEFSNNEVLEFLNQSDNFDTLTNAINGSEDALRQLQNSAREYSNLQVDIKAILDTDSFDFDYQSFLGWFNSDEVQNAGQLTFTAGLDSSVFIEQLNQALKDGKITAEQIRGLFNSLGWDVDFEYEEIEVPHLVTDKNAYGGGGGGKPQVTIQQGTDTIKVPKNIRYINKDQSTKAANTPQGFNSSQKDKINSESGSGGGGGSDKEETPEIYDWIETRISRLERDIQNFDKVVNASYKNWGERLGAIPKEYDKVLQEIETQNAGYVRYMQEASKVGLPEEYAQKVRDGLIDIESITDETLKQGINDYKQWYEKAIQCADAVEDLRAKLAELAKLKFDNIATIFDSVLESVSHLNSLISTAMDTVETQGYLVSKAYYERMTEYESYNLSKLNQEYEELKKARQEALDSGAIEENSQDWWDMQHSIEGVESAIYDAKKALAEYADAMRQIEWDLFDRTQGYISQITDESDWIQALLRTEHTITNDETGRLNEYGKSIGGLTAVDYNVYMRQSQMYADEIEKINKELANDLYNAKLIDRRNELLNLQRQSIQAAEDEKEAIRSLIKESYDEMLRILQELIDKRKEALQAEKDLYDYQKNIQSQADNINSLRKQILALSGDESEENQARLQSLRTELSTAESDLEDTEYDKWLSDQNEAMDNMYQSAEDFLNERLKNIDLLVTEVIATTNDNAELISDTINTEVAEAGYNLTTEMENIWDGQQKIVSDFQGTFVDGVGQVIDTQYVSTVAVCDSIAAYTVAMMNNSTAIANGILNNINQNSSQIFNNINATINAINQGTSSITSYLNSILSACNNIAAKVGTGGGSAGGGGGTNTSTTTSYNTPNTIPNTAWTDSRHYSNSGGYVVGGKTTFVHHETGGYAWKETRKIAYAEGGTIGKALRKSGEDGIILAKTGEEVLSLEKIAGMKDVLNAFEPLALAIHKMPNVGTSINNGSTNNEINVSFEFPNVNNYEQFIQTARTDARFERIIQQMTIGNALGGNTLKKYTL